jgi:hypothetical protein
MDAKLLCKMLLDNVHQETPCSSSRKHRLTIGVADVLAQSLKQVTDSQVEYYHTS